MSSVGLSPLLFGSYSKDTQAKYIAAVTAFALWCESLAILPRSSRELDIHLSNYMADLWFTGKGKNAATCTFYGLDMFMPGIRHKLPVSLRSMWFLSPLPIRTSPTITLDCRDRHSRLVSCQSQV
jgi:hypothetical protein